VISIEAKVLDPVPLFEKGDKNIILSKIMFFMLDIFPIS
jgi:hypothetical protein